MPATTPFSAERVPWIEGVAMPVGWKQRHGAGRIFYSSLEHVVSEIEVAQGRSGLRRE